MSHFHFPRDNYNLVIVDHVNRVTAIFLPLIFKYQDHTEQYQNVTITLKTIIWFLIYMILPPPQPPILISKCIHAIPQCQESQNAFLKPSILLINL